MLAIRDPYRGLEKCGLWHNWCGHLDLCLFIFCDVNGTRVSYDELEFSSGIRCSNCVSNTKYLVPISQAKLFFVAFTLFVFVSDCDTQWNRVLLIAPEITVTHAE